MIKNWLKTYFFLIFYLVLLIFVGLYARSSFLDPQKPFPTWTYNSDLKVLNLFTSWDSGFYYDLSQNWYPQTNTKINKSQIQIPENSWVKIFLGTAIVGEQKFALPESTENNLINNMLVVVNQNKQSTNFPIYNSYEGITYCLYKGGLNYERDIKSFNESLTNPKSCGEVACSSSYVSIYDSNLESVIFQEKFSLSNLDKPEIFIGNSFPIYNFQDEFKGFGCRTIGKENITLDTLKNYENSYTTLAFMPLYSLLVNFASAGFADKVLVGILISTISLIISILLIFKLTFEITKNKDQAYFSALAFLSIPGSFYLFTFLDISLLTMLSLATIYLSYRNKNLFSALFFGLLIYTNLLGIVLLIPLFFIKENKFEKLVLHLITGVFVILGHTYYLYLKTGDLLILLNSKIPWYSDASSFLGGFVNYFRGFEIFRILEVGIPLIFIFLMFLITRKVKNGFNFLGFSIMLLGISIINAGFTGIIKFLPLCLLPYCIYLYQNLKHKNIFWLILVICLFLNLILFTLWTVSSRLVV